MSLLAPGHVMIHSQLVSIGYATCGQFLVWRVPPDAVSVSPHRDGVGGSRVVGEVGGVGEGVVGEGVEVVMVEGLTTGIIVPGVGGRGLAATIIVPG